MNSRAIEILRTIVIEAKTISGLSREFNVTERTIRNDLNSINDFLQEKGLERIESDLDGQLRINLDPSQILSLLDRSDFYSFKLSKREREILITYALVQTKSPITIKKLTELLYVSRSTINNDIETIRKTIRQDNLNLKAYSNKGLLVEAREEDIRDYLSRLLDDSNSTLSIDQFDYVEEFFFDDFEQFTSYEREILDKIVTETLEAFNISLDDISLIKLENYLEILIKRNRRGFFVDNIEIEGEEHFKFIDEIYELIGLYFDIKPNENEKRALENIIRHLTFIPGKTTNKNLVEIQLFIRNFIRKISASLGIDLNDDYEFYESLSNHLTSIQIDDGKFNDLNPFVEQIVNENPRVLEAVLDNITGIETFIGRTLNDVDLSYIVVHICAALERKEARQHDIDVILVCNAGIGTSRILQQRLKKHFNLSHVRIQTPQSPLKPSQNLLVITTVDLKQPGLNYVKVKPVLADEDYIKIGQRIEQLHQKADKKTSENVRDENAVNTLIQEINRAILDESLDTYKKMENVDDIVLEYLGILQAHNPRLYELLKPEFIILDAEVEDWKEAIRLSGTPLVERKIVEESYVEACIEMIEKYGPYMLIGEKVLLPHSYVEEGNSNVGFTFVRLKNELTLENGQAVRFICMMSAVDESKHLRALFTLSNLVQNPEYLEQIKRAKSRNEVYKIIRNFDFMKLPLNLY